MRTVYWHARTTRATVQEAVRVLRKGGVIAYPTETSYGLGADATNMRACARMFRIKGRAEEKRVSCLVSGQRMTRGYAIVTPVARALWRLLPGPLTLVLPDRRGGTMGVRVSSHPFAHALARAYGRPITATSANLAGQPALYDADAVLRVFVRRTQRPDLLIHAGRLPRRKVSTVVDCTGESVRILRKGAVSAKTIYEKT